MKRLALLAFLSAPGGVLAQSEKASDVRLSPSLGATAAPAAAAPASLSLAVPALTAAPPAAAPSAAAPFASPAPPAALAAPQPVMAPATVPTMRPSPESGAAGARGELAQGARASAAPAADAGRRLFDGETRTGDAPSGPARAAGAPGLARPGSRPPASAPAIPLSQRAFETAELGVLAAGAQALAGAGFLALGALGARAAFPALEGAFWALAGVEFLRYLAALRGVRVGGWQASHDQKMRTDYGTGQLRDIRGRKYGEDRFDVYAPGPVSTRERWTITAAALALGLPWVLPGGARAVALYAAGAAAAFGLRRLLRARRPAAPAPDAPHDFDPER
jgi:hypothetical protein